MEIMGDLEQFSAAERGKCPNGSSKENGGKRNWAVLQSYALNGRSEKRVLAGEGRKVKKCVLGDCLYASWKGPVEFIGRIRKEMNVRNMNELFPGTKSAWTTQLSHTWFVSEGA